MADAWIEFGLSNSCVAAALALLAHSVHRRGRHPLLAHALWLGVLLKLVTPSLFTVPLLPYPAAASTIDLAAVDPAMSELSLEELTPLVAGADLGAPPASAPALSVRALVGWAWLIGSALVLVGSLLRTLRFQLTMVRGTRVAGDTVRALAKEVARGHGLRRCPEVRVTAARVTPFVWQFWGRVRVVLPEGLARSLPAAELRLVLAHELAHVRRKDHWVRWVEWLAAVAFWWNPLTWWSQRNLRASEELACDALVLSTFRPRPQRYASSLLSVAEFLSTEGVRPPRVATPMSRGGELESRLTMILTDRLPRTPRWVLSAALALGAALLPLSVAYAQDYGAVERRLAAAVEAGEITKTQAQAMMAALKRAVEEKSGPAEPDIRARRMRYAEYQKSLEAAVAKGDMTADEAAAKLAEARTKMFGGEAAGKRDIDPRAMRERYAQLEERVTAAVESGQITKEQAAERLAQARERMMQASRTQGAGDGPVDMRARRMRYAELEKGLKARVEKGAMSAEEAEAKLREAREKMFGDQKARKLDPRTEKKDAARGKRPDDGARGKGPDEGSMKARYAEYEQRLDAAVARGELTVEEARAKLAEARKKMFGDQKARKLDKKTRKLDQKAEKKDAAREKRADDGARGKGPDEGAMKARYAEYEKRLDAAVARGELTAEEAKAKLAEARKKMFGE